ncbi:MAG: glycosyltransferase family 4 protein [Patescibacteria group bacterium]|nr:glycosyltransferase family 4 protein [Patescibacteria group bacterium]
MKKILYFITQSEFGGAQRYVFDLANNLRADYEVAVAMGEQGNSGKLAKILVEHNIKFFIIPHLKRNLSPLNDLLAFFDIIKLIKNYRPDIIHLNSSKISILGSLAAYIIRIFAIFAFHSQYSHSIRNIRIIYTVHGWVFNEPLPGWLKYFYLHAEKFTARFKDKIICVSEYDKQIALKHKIAPAYKLTTIHNGLAPTNFYSREEAKRLLFAKIENRKSKIENFLIGSIGNLYKTKGYEYFVQAAYILIHERRTSATFIIIGQGAARKNLEDLIKKYHLENNFILTGQLDDAARLLPALDLYVCSSVKEGFPYSILEAMQAGLPIVTTNVGGIPEMVEDLSASSGQATGLLAKPTEADNLAEKIKILLNNKTLAQKLGQRAKIKAITEFGLEKMVEATKRLYRLDS